MYESLRVVISWWQELCGPWLAAAERHIAPVKKSTRKSDHEEPRERWRFTTQVGYKWQRWGGFHSTEREWETLSGLKLHLRLFLKRLIVRLSILDLVLKCSWLFLQLAPNRAVWKRREDEIYYRNWRVSFTFVSNTVLLYNFDVVELTSHLALLTLLGDWLVWWRLLTNTMVYTIVIVRGDILSYTSGPDEVILLFKWDYRCLLFDGWGPGGQHVLSAARQNVLDRFPVMSGEAGLLS